MKKSCPKCKGKGSSKIDKKICESCDGNGFQESFEVKNHFKDVSNNAKAKFDLKMDQDIFCGACNGKGMIDILEKCEVCKGAGEINVCESCGKIIKEDNYCKSCKVKLKEVNNNRKIIKVFELDPVCGIEDLEIGLIYKGKISKVEKYGVFVSLNKKVWGLMRTENPFYSVGEKIFVEITEIKPHKREVDMISANIIGDIKIEQVKKNMVRTRIDSLDSKSMGKFVRIEGEVIQVQQTSGPTIFSITDETGMIWVAAFDETGVRAYPHIGTGDIVEAMGEVNQHSGKVQIESEVIEKLDPERLDSIRQIIDKGLNEKAEPENVPALIKSPILDKLQLKMRESAKIIRKAIMSGRTVLLRHHADADGISAGVALEKAILPLIKELNPSNDAEWHYFRRSPSKAPFYELEDLMKDLSFAFEDLERHGQKLPLIVLLDNGSTEEDVLALMIAKIYDIEIVVIDHHFPGEVVDGKVAVSEFVDVHVNPYFVGGDSQITTGALAVEIANIINPEIKELISHLSGVAALGDHAKSNEVEEYIELAGEKGYSKEDLEKIAACVDFEAYYLRFMDGRGIMDTILGVDNIDKHQILVDTLYQEYQRRVNAQLKSTLANIKKELLQNGIHFNVLDIEKYAHKFTFPAPGKTCGFVHDKFVKELDEEAPIITLCFGPDFAVVRATEVIHKKFGFNLNEVIWELQDKIPEAGIDGGGHEVAGSIKFVEGLSKEVLSSFAKEITSLSPNKL